MTSTTPETAAHRCVDGEVPAKRCWRCGEIGADTMPPAPASDREPAQPGVGEAAAEMWAALVSLENDIEGREEAADIDGLAEAIIRTRLRTIRTEAAAVAREEVALRLDVLAKAADHQAGVFAQRKETDSDLTHARSEGLMTGYKSQANRFRNLAAKLRATSPPPDTEKDT